MNNFQLVSMSFWIVTMFWNQIEVLVLLHGMCEVPSLLL